MELENKKILFISPAFFGYENKIVEKMEELGAKVDFFDERPFTDSFSKAILKISPKFFFLKTKKYYDQIINNKSSLSYDFVFVVKCEMMTVEIIKKLRRKFPQAVFCLYLWDSLANIKGVSKKIDYFDRVLSFDMNDTDRNANIKFRPLFFTDDYKKKYNDLIDFEYDFSFIGTIHSDRYKIIKAISKHADENNQKYFLYCYLQSKLIYYFYKILKKEFHGERINNFKFKKIDSSIISDVVEHSRSILDIQHPRQTGLTMRTIEMLGMHKKLITTNQSIKKYDFYNPDNIVVIDRNKILIPKDFLNKPHIEVDQSVYDKYSLKNWVIDVLGV